MIKKVLITGGTGFIGGVITKILQSEGYEVAYLSRSSETQGTIRKYKWSVKDSFIDDEALKWADAIIHLAGASVADKKWNEKRKKEILESRTESSRLLFEKLKENKYRVKKIISASAIGYYGFGSAEQIFTEESPAGNDFLADVTEKWEEETAKFSELGVENVRIRIGIVLSSRGGAFAKLAGPIKLGVGSPLGSGQQMMSWIHVNDLANIFVFFLKNHLQGIYNGVAPVPASNEKLTKIAAHMFRRKIILPNVPEFALKLLLGEMAEIVIKGANISSRKIEDSGFKFKFPLLSDAIYDLVLRKA